MTQRIGENRVKDSSITNAKIVSVANTKITGLVTSAQIASVANTQITGLVTSAQIASVANTQITGVINTAQIADSAITTAKIAAGAVITVDIADANVTDAKIVSVSNTKITGILTVSQGGTGTTSSTGSGSVVLGTSPTVSGITINDGYTEEVYAVIDAAGVALSPTNGSIQTWTLGASRTPTQGTWAAGQSMTLMINDGTAFTVTWTSIPVTWVGGSAPTLALTGFTVIEFWKVGSTVYGSLVGTVA